MQIKPLKMAPTAVPSASASAVLVAVLSAAFVATTANAAFYLPGIAPSEFAGGDEVVVTVNKLNSVKTQLPFDYYRFNFCAPDDIKKKSENLGEVRSQSIRSVVMRMMTLDDVD